MKLNRERKHSKSFWLSEGTLKILLAISVEDGCSQSEVMTVATHHYQHYRNTLVTIAGMQKEPLMILGDVMKREIGVYQSTIDKCQAFFDRDKFDYSREKRQVIHLMETCDYHLNHDLCTQEEREVFVKFIDWGQKFLEHSEKGE
jgi:hypothetical protein